MSGKICSIHGCDKPVKARGLCNPHWKRWRRWGNPLAGRIDNGEAHRYLRDVVLAYEGDECLIWPYARDGHGYARIRLDEKSQIISRIVCQEVNGNPPTALHQAAHTCGKGSVGCVAKHHLEWKTQSENEADKVLHGTAIHPGSYLPKDSHGRWLPLEDAA